MMNKLTPIFIAGAIAVSAGLAIAQSQMNKDDPMKGHDMTGMDMLDMETPASDSLSTKAYLAVNNSVHFGMMIEFTGDADIDRRHDPAPSGRDRYGESRA